MLFSTIVNTFHYRRVTFTQPTGSSGAFASTSSPISLNCKHNLIYLQIHLSTAYISSHLSHHLHFCVYKSGLALRFSLFSEININKIIYRIKWKEILDIFINWVKQENMTRGTISELADDEVYTSLQSRLNKINESPKKQVSTDKKWSTRLTYLVKNLLYINIKTFLCWYVFVWNNFWKHSF